jgi:hypothetical protein
MNGIGLGPWPMASCVTNGVEPAWAFSQRAVHFSILMQVRAQTVVCWVVTTCILEGGHQRFEGTICLYLQDDSECV